MLFSFTLGAQENQSPQCVMCNGPGLVKSMKLSKIKHPAKARESTQREQTVCSDALCPIVTALKSLEWLSPFNQHPLKINQNRPLTFFKCATY